MRDQRADLVCRPSPNSSVVKTMAMPAASRQPIKRMGCWQDRACFTKYLQPLRPLYNLQRMRKRETDKERLLGHNSQTIKVVVDVVLFDGQSCECKGHVTLSKARASILLLT